MDALQFNIIMKEIKEVNKKLEELRWDVCHTRSISNEIKYILINQYPDQNENYV